MLFEGLIGSIVGLIGSAFTAYQNYKLKQLEIEDNKAKRAHEIALIQAQTAATIQEAQAQMEIVRTQVAGAIDLEETGAYRDSIKDSSGSFLSSEWLTHMLNGSTFMKVCGSILVVLLGIAEWLKDIMRPTLTTYLMIVTTWLTVKSWKLMEQSGTVLTQADAMGIVRDVTQCIIFLTVSSVTWWYSDRQASKFIQQHLTKKS